MKRYFWLLPTGLVLGVIGLIVGFFLHGKNAPQVESCGTKLGIAHQLVSGTFRATCASAKSMMTTGNVVMIAGGIVAAVIVILGIAYFVTRNTAQSAT